MGACKLYKCRCGYEKQIMAGGGISSQDLRIISRNIPEELFEEFSREELSGNVIDFGMIRSIISCPNCKSLDTVTDFWYTLAESEFRYVSPCPVCGEECQPLEDTETIRCPKCKAKMNCSVVGLWD